MQPSSASSIGIFSLYKLENHFKIFKRDLAAYFAALYQWFRMIASAKGCFEEYFLVKQERFNLSLEAI